MRVHLINTAEKGSTLKMCEIIPSLQLAWWRGGFNIGIFWLNFGIQLAVGTTFEISKRNEQGKK